MGDCNADLLQHYLVCKGLYLSIKDVKGHHLRVFESLRTSTHVLYIVLCHLSYDWSSDSLGMFEQLLGGNCIGVHLRNGEFGHFAVSEKQK